MSKTNKTIEKLTNKIMSFFKFKRFFCKENLYKMKNTSTLLNFALIIFSLLTIFLIIFDFSKPEYYNALFLLPLTFIFISVVYSKLYKLIPSNLGVSLILALFFVRMVLSPFFMCLGSYQVTINHNIDQNTIYAIGLVCYEALLVFFFLYYVNFMKTSKVNIGNVTLKKNESRKSTRIFSFEFSKNKQFIIYSALIASILILIIISVIIVPDILSGFRPITDMVNPNFSSFEDAYLVTKFGTTFIKKLAIVVGIYLIRAICILLPTYVLVVISKLNNQSIMNKILSWLVCFIPLLCVGGTIAQSLIYVVVLILLRSFLYPSKNTYKILFAVGATCCIFIFAYWTMREIMTEGEDFLGDFSKRFSAYFSGVNIVSGTFNMPITAKNQITYFIYDYLSTMPFGNTVFGLDSSIPSIHVFFNNCNLTQGQIPTTIGMGYYYFGFLFAPIYSLIFAIVVNLFSIKIYRVRNPFTIMRYLLTIIWFSMGIVMYNIEITLTNYFTIILPLYIMELVSFKREELL